MKLPVQVLQFDLLLSLRTFKSARSGVRPNQCQGEPACDQSVRARAQEVHTLFQLRPAPLHFPGPTRVLRIQIERHLRGSAANTPRPARALH
jgi:hypothetical protein